MIPEVSELIHECDTMPNYLDIKRLAKNDWQFHHYDGGYAGFKFCPFCGVILEDTFTDKENYAKKSAALIISTHLHISEQGAEQIVELLIDAVKHELKGR